MMRRQERKVREKVERRLQLPTRKRVRRIAIQQTAIVFGALLSGLGYAIFQVPYDLAAGGVSGLGIIFNKYTDFPVGLFFLLANAPLLVWGFYKLGRWRFLISSIGAVVGFSVSADFFNLVLPQVADRWPITDDVLLAAIYAGVLYGVGMGLVYRHGGSIGGTSVPARIIHNATGFPMSQAFLYTDVGVILLAGLLISWEVALLAFLSLVLTGLFSDFILEGVSQVRTAVIITDNPEPLTYALMHELRRGVSYWTVKGGYTGADHTMIYCTVLRSRVYELKFVVGRVDPKAFMVVGVAQQAFGGLNFKKLQEQQDDSM